MLYEYYVHCQLSEECLTLQCGRILCQSEIREYEILRYKYVNNGSL